MVIVRVHEVDCDTCPKSWKIYINKTFLDISLNWVISDTDLENE